MPWDCPGLLIFSFKNQVNNTRTSSDKQTSHLSKQESKDGNQLLWFEQCLYGICLFLNQTNSLIRALWKQRKRRLCELLPMIGSEASKWKLF